MNAPLRSPWPLVRLGQIAEFIRGVTYKPADVSIADDPDAIACMRTKNIQTDLEVDDLVFIPRSPIKESKLLRGGDILVSTANSWNLVGKCCWVPNLPYKATFGGFTSVLRADPTRAFPRYLYHWFATDRTQQLARSLGQQTTNISNLNQARCLELEISLPLLDEQRRIATILDKADALRRKRKRALDLLGNLTQSIFLEMFGSQSGGRTYQLADLVDSSDRINYGVVQPGEDDPDGIYLVRVSDLRNGRVSHSNLRKVSKQINTKHGRSALKGNEILISCVGSIGEIAVTSDAESGFNIARAVARVPLDDKILRTYVAEYLRSPNVQRYFTKELRTVSQPTLNIKQISETRITIPLESELKEFDRRVRSVGDGLNHAQLQSSRFDFLFTSLQSNAFSGQL